eukprot:3773346-Rhodomonas_salina.5
MRFFTRRIQPVLCSEELYVEIVVVVEVPGSSIPYVSTAYRIARAHDRCHYQTTHSEHSLRHWTSLSEGVVPYRTSCCEVKTMSIRNRVESA